jgi:hypothetical protein
MAKIRICQQDITWLPRSPAEPDIELITRQVSRYNVPDVAGRLAQAQPDVDALVKSEPFRLQTSKLSGCRDTAENTSAAG